MFLGVPKAKISPIFCTWKSSGLFSIETWFFFGIQLHNFKIHPTSIISFGSLDRVSSVTHLNSTAERTDGKFQFAITELSGKLGTFRMGLKSGSWFSAEKSTKSMPWKINMEHTNHPFGKENDLKQTPMIMFHVNLPGCMPSTDLKD